MKLSFEDQNSHLIPVTGSKTLSQTVTLCMSESTHLGLLVSYFPCRLQEWNYSEGIRFSAVLELCFCLKSDTMAKDQ